ncbi:MAG: DUF2892 domain-containing protein [Nitrospirae bacterium]|nr:DUF2892 domain-containing protein [Nitrospirota bacterium]
MRVLFIAVAAAVVGSLLAAGVYFKSWWGAVGAIPLLTGFVGICLIYKILGVSTCCTTCKIK